MLINDPSEANLLYIMPVLVLLVKVVYMLLVICCVLTVVDFAERFPSNLASIQKERADSTWLRAQCKDQKFLENLRHHKDLCETDEKQVERQTQTNAYFVAIQQTWDKRPWYERRMPLYSATPMRPSSRFKNIARALLMRATPRVVSN